MEALLIMVGIAISLVVAYVWATHDDRKRDKIIDQDRERRRLRNRIQSLEHQEMPPPYQHEQGCPWCQEREQVLDLAYEGGTQWVVDEVVVQELSGPVKLFKHRAVYVPDPPPAIAQPETVQR